MSQRSAGMHVFAALLAFLTAKSVDSQSRPVLLVDEAEMHLHYDAQADLVRLFEHQDVAQVVVYTTHSIGCLPEDLGLSVVVVEECGEERSRLSQSFWTRGPGLTPLMLALGATALSFTPARRVVIGEGAHEAILLPTLLREVRKTQDLGTPLGFQVVGGLAEIAADAVGSLDEEAGTVVYLVDNDEGGRQIRALLPQSIRSAGRSLVLGDGTDITCIEDCVSAEVLVRTIDTVLAEDGKTPLSLNAADVPASGRAAWVDQHLAAGGSPAARTRLAQAAVLNALPGGLGEPSRTGPLKALLSSIRAIFPD
jgi:AAA domain, putative AbiEii toxin, Type IV TA system